MAKTAKKAAPKAAKKAPVKKTSVAARLKSVAATPARMISRRRDGKNEVTAVIGSVTTEEISLRAYYIGERRRNLGLPGNAESDWIEAERQLRN